MQVNFIQNIHTLGFTVIAYSTLLPVVCGMIDILITDDYGNMVSVLDNHEAMRYSTQ